LFSADRIYNEANFNNDMAAPIRNMAISEQVDYLLALAQKKVKTDETLAKKYVKIAREIAMRHRVPLGRKRKMLFCKKCSLPWIAGNNCAVRIRSREKKIEYACACGAKMNLQYGKRRGE